VILANRAAPGIERDSEEEGGHKESMAAIRKLPSLKALREVGLYRERSMKESGARPFAAAPILSFQKETKSTR
jgi:hypothetical protein